MISVFLSKTVYEYYFFVYFVQQKLWPAPLYPFWPSLQNFCFINVLSGKNRFYYLDILNNSIEVFLIVYGAPVEFF